MKNILIIVGIIGLSVLILYPFAASGASFTLSDSAIMSLDYNYHSVSSLYDGSILNITDVEGPGVEFDIKYSDPTHIQKFPDLFWISGIKGGSGALTGIDIHSYDAFALKFTLLSANGVSSSNAVGPIIVGAAINRADVTSAFRPERIAINDPYTPSSTTSVTTTDASQINLVGFICYIPYWLYDPTGTYGPNPWDPTGATISLLVEPAPGAAVITPEPATLLLLAVGALAARRKR